MSGQTRKQEATNDTNIDLGTNLSKTEMRDIVKQRIKGQWDEERKVALQNNRGNEDSRKKQK